LQLPTEKKQAIEDIIIYWEASVADLNRATEKLFCRLGVARQKESLRIFVPQPLRLLSGGIAPPIRLSPRGQHGLRNIVTKYSVAFQSMDCVRRPCPEKNAVDLIGSAFSGLFCHGQDGIDGDVLGHALRACELQLSKQGSRKNEGYMRKSIHGTVKYQHIAFRGSAGVSGCVEQSNGKERK
jgi:hypothetical protein